MVAQSIVQSRPGGGVRPLRAGAHLQGPDPHAVCRAACRRGGRERWRVCAEGPGPRQSLVH
ncbi:hypothetical protein D8B24_21995, partial [Verminephrobacter aporrectodeae subsp. tuberculatae]|nr:hypothetical protein [Verminephrobacter aporrectodeae subsp. tuberculatae]